MNRRRRWLVVLAAVGALRLAAQSGLVPAPANLIALPAGWRLAPEAMAGFPAGVQIYVFEGQSGGVAVKSAALVWDPTSPAVSFKPVLAATARTPTQLAAAETGRVFAAVNGGFFGGNQSFSLVQYQGAVLAANVKSLSRTFQGSATAYFPTRAAFGFAAGGRATADWIYHVGTGNNVVYAYPAPSPNRLNTAPQPVPTAQFPEGGAPWTMEHAIGGSPMLVKDGAVRITDAEELIDINNTSRRARTAIGHTASGIALLVAVEGDNPAGAPGMTLAELAAWMRGLGCVGAVNLDGGGSTAFASGGRAFVRPSDGAERPVISALLLVDPVSSTPATAAPAIVHPPGDLTVAAGAPATLQVGASGGGLRYAWTFNGAQLAGATTAALTFAAVAPAQAGRYAVTVTNARGTVTSRTATLAVTTAVPGELVNLSVRAACGPGEDTLIGGFVLRDGSDTMLMRGVGPGLGVLGVTGFLEDPQIELLAGNGTVLATNDDWEAATVSAAAAAAGAFPLRPGSGDAALLRTVAAGPHMVAATPARGASRGNLLIEIYDRGAGGGVLANISARARVAPAGGELIAGFVVRGDAAMTVLIRAAGPALRALGVGEALAAPTLTLVRDGTVVAANTGWGTATNAVDVREAARRTGAFAFAAGSADAALLVTLPPGAYTALVGTAAGEGVGLVEVYELR